MYVKQFKDVSEINRMSSWLHARFLFNAIFVIVCQSIQNNSSQRRTEEDRYVRQVEGTPTRPP